MHKLCLGAAIAMLALTPAFGQAPPTAQATFHDAQGNEVGTVRLAHGDTSVNLLGEILGMTPGEHGFHFHETGDCDGTTGFESAGGHFNPTGHKHGLESVAGPHAGDLPNVEAAADGTVAIDMTSGLVSLKEGDPRYVFDDDGTALVIHAAPDDGISDPSGNSGDRIACAVIEATP